MATIREQIHRNAVALISLVIAVGSLAYNTWRNETTEAQRNTRHASFRVLESLGELQQVADYHYYFVENEGSDDGEQWLRGWGQVTLVRDLTMVMPGTAPEAGLAIYQLWESRFSQLDDRDSQGRRTPQAMEAKDEIIQGIEDTRTAVIRVLRSLE
ncbi:MAG: hypothetical protein HKO64_03770 [Xanthomonadales bacterium]|nr:hypothetical protein [Gammaproteobacteria bacterium]NNE06002.1 hypothetical protein [Xanthomonadales bacterium]NNL94717.1 hypothetical protein [Xanthomonadales bacterium]